MSPTRNFVSAPISVSETITCLFGIWLTCRCRRHVANMSPTFPAKPPLKLYAFSACRWCLHTKTPFGSVGSNPSPSLPFARVSKYHALCCGIYMRVINFQYIMLSRKWFDYWLFTSWVFIPMSTCRHPNEIAILKLNHGFFFNRKSTIDFWLRVSKNTCTGPKISRGLHQYD